MTTTPSPLVSRARRAPRGQRVVRWAIRAVILAIVFGIGVAVGQALEDRPRAEKPVTNASTIRPWTQTQP